MVEKLMNGMLVFAAKLSSQRHLGAIRNAFTALLPVVVTGSFCTLISNVVCSVRPGFVSVANLPGMSWLGNLAPIFTAANYGTMNFISIGIIILIALGLSESYGMKDFTVAPVALGAYISLCLTTSTVACDVSKDVIHEVANVLAVNFTDAKGLFVGLITSLCATEIYCKLIQSGKLEIKLPESVPSNVAYFIPCMSDHTEYFCCWICFPEDYRHDRVCGHYHLYSETFDAYTYGPSGISVLNLHDHSAVGVRYPWNSDSVCSIFSHSSVSLCRE